MPKIIAVSNSVLIYINARMAEYCGWTVPGQRSEPQSAPCLWLLPTQENRTCLHSTPSGCQQPCFSSCQIPL